MTIFEKDRARERFNHWIEYFKMNINDIREQYNIRTKIGRKDVFTNLMREYIITDYEFDMVFSENAEELHSKVEDASLCDLEREAAGNMLLRLYPEYYKEVYNDTESDY